MKYQPQLCYIIGGKIYKSYPDPIFLCFSLLQLALIGGNATKILKEAWEERETGVDSWEVSKVLYDSSK